MNYDSDTHGVRKMVNLILVFAGLGFIVSVATMGHQYFQVNRSGWEARFFPPTEDWTFRNWRQGESGRWSAEVYFYKARPECIYVANQVITVTYANTLGEVGESRINFIGDETPGSSRPEGWQRADTRVEFLNPEIAPGTVVRGTFLHQCHEGLPTVSGFNRVVVGVDMPWPPYVQDWLDSGRKGVPGDYR